MSRVVVAARNLEKRFGHKIVLNNFDHEFFSGITALVGRNGSGKTTLIKCISSQIAPTRGKIVYNGVTLPDEAAWRRARRGFSWTFQDVSAPITLTVGEILAFSSGTSKMALEGGRRLEMLEPILEPLRRRAWNMLSFGQRKLVALAVAALRPSYVLLLDEPVAGLAQNFVEAVSTTLKTLSDDGRAIIMSEHNRAFIESTADQAVVLSNGKPVYSGPPSLAFQSTAVLEALI